MTFPTTTTTWRTALALAALGLVSAACGDLSFDNTSVNTPGEPTTDDPEVPDENQVDDDRCVFTGGFAVDAEADTVAVVRSAVDRPCAEVELSDADIARTVFAMRVGGEPIPIDIPTQHVGHTIGFWNDEIVVYSSEEGRTSHVHFVDGETLEVDAHVETELRLRFSGIGHGAMLADGGRLLDFETRELLSLDLADASALRFLPGGGFALAENASGTTVLQVWSARPSDGWAVLGGSRDAWPEPVWRHEVADAERRIVDAVASGIPARSGTHLAVADAADGGTEGLVEVEILDLETGAWTEPVAMGMTPVALTGERYVTWLDDTNAVGETSFLGAILERDGTLTPLDVAVPTLPRVVRNVAADSAVIVSALFGRDYVALSNLDSPVPDVTEVRVPRAGQMVVDDDGRLWGAAEGLWRVEPGANEAVEVSASNLLDAEPAHVSALPGRDLLVLDDTTRPRVLFFDPIRGLVVQQVRFDDDE